MDRTGKFMAATYYDKLDNVTRFITDKTGIGNIVPGSIAYQIAQAIAYESYQQELKIDKEIDNNSILSAIDIYLDNIGDNFFGVKRKEARAPYVSEGMKALKFYVLGDRPFGAINSNNDITISKGTIISGSMNGNAVRFVVSEDTILGAAYYEGYVNAQLLQGPNSIITSNVLIKHSFTSYTDYQNSSLLVTNPYPILTGREKESDEDYRYRIQNSLRSLNQANIDGVLAVARSVQGVSDVTCYQAQDGAGTFTIYVQGITPITSDETITNVELALLQECATPWCDFNVLKPDYLGISMDINISLTTTNSVANQDQFLTTIKSNIESYINNFNDTTLYFIDLKRQVLNISSDIANVEIVACTMYRGTDQFRQSEAIDLTSESSIVASDLEKIVVEPITDAITVSIG